MRVRVELLDSETRDLVAIDFALCDKRGRPHIEFFPGTYLMEIYDTGRLRDRHLLRIIDGEQFYVGDLT